MEQRRMRAERCLVGMFALLLLAVGAVGANCIQVKAASGGEYTCILSPSESNGDKKKVGNYYYWIKESRKKWKIMREAVDTGQKETVYEAGGRVKVKVEGDSTTWTTMRYSVCDVYVNDTYLVFGEFDAKVQKMNFVRVRIGSKKKKKIASHVIPYYHPMSASYMANSVILGVYNNDIYYQKPKKKGDSYRGVTYKTNMKTGKTSRVKALKWWNTGHHFDGRYIYIYGNAYDCQTGKFVNLKMAKLVDHWMRGTDGELYADYLTKNGEMFYVYKVVDGNFETVAQISTLDNFGTTRLYFCSIEKVTEQEMYFQAVDGGVI